MHIVMYKKACGSFNRAFDQSDGLAVLGVLYEVGNFVLLLYRVLASHVTSPLSTPLAPDNCRKFHKWQAHGNPT